MAKREPRVTQSFEIKTQIMTFPFKGQVLFSGDPDGVSDNMYDFFGSVLKDNGFEPLLQTPDPNEPSLCHDSYGAVRLRFEKINHWRDHRRPNKPPLQQLALELTTQISCFPERGTTHYSGDPDSDSHNSYHLLADLLSDHFATLEKTEDPFHSGHDHQQHGAFLVRVEKLEHWRDERRRRQRAFQEGRVPIKSGPRSRPSLLAERSLSETHAPQSQE